MKWMRANAWCAYVLMDSNLRNITNAGVSDKEKTFIFPLIIFSKAFLKAE